MITQQSPNSIFSATYQGKNINNAYYIYADSAGYMFLRHVGMKPVIYTIVGFGAAVSIERTQYQSDFDGSLMLSMRKWMDTVGAGKYLRLNVSVPSASDPSESETLQLFLNVLPGIDYADSVRPSEQGLKNWELGYTVSVLPPNVMYSCPLRNGINLQMESSHAAYDEENEGGNWSQLIGDSETGLSVSGLRNNQVTFSGGADRLVFAGSAIWILSKLQKCVDMAILQWTSQTGAVRRHLFPVRRHSAVVNGEIRLINLSDGITVLKNFDSGFTIFADGLTSYGWWYYADMLRASDLHAIYGVDAIEAGDALEALQLPLTAAYCEESGYSVPQGVGVFNFSATIRYRSYGQF